MSPKKPEVKLNEHNLRPQTLTEYIGQDKIVKTLKMFLDAMKKRGHASEHLMLYGPPGIGKTTLAYIIAHELNSEIKITSGPVLQKSGDLAAILTNLKDGDILFIDEIHRIPKSVEEILYPVLEEYHLDIIIGKGPSARTVRLDIPKITIIGATTRLALLSGPLRDRFGLILRLDYYNEKDIAQIVTHSARHLNLPITSEAAISIAQRARKTPRIANNILKRARDFFEVNLHKTIDQNMLIQLFNLLDLDTMGLNNQDRKYLRLIGEKFQNVPIGLDTIALSLSEDLKTIEEFVEPYLLQIGFIRKTPRGRVLTRNALSHLGIKNVKRDVEQDTLV